MSRVLLFNTCAPAHLAARLHDSPCPMVNMTKRRGPGGGKVRLNRDVTEDDITDLNERGFTVWECKCLASKKGSPMQPQRHPSKPELAAFVASFAAYLATQQGGSIKTQQAAYERYAKRLHAIRLKYPHIDFASQTSVDALFHAAKKLNEKKLFRGPGATY